MIQRVKTGVIADGAITTAKMNDEVENLFSFRNLLINGDMRVAQRNTSASGVTTIDYFTVDRWKNFDIGTTAAVYTIEQSTDVPSGQGFTNSLKYTFTTADASPNSSARLQLLQVIEGFNCARLAYGTSAAKTITVSFWVKAKKTGTNYMFPYLHSSSGHFTTVAYTINQADTWEYKTVTFPGNTTNGMSNLGNGSGLNIQFALYLGSEYTSGTYTANTWQSWESANYPNLGPNQTNHADAVNNYIAFTGIQAEIGSVATPFEFRPYGTELQLCQRYCCVNTPVYYTRYPMFGSGPNTGIWFAEFPVPMRSQPSLITKNITSSTVEGYNYSTNAPTGNYSSVSVAEGDSYRIQVDWTWASGISTGQVASWRWIGSPASYLGFSSEL